MKCYRATESKCCSFIYKLNEITILRQFYLFIFMQHTNPITISTIKIILKFSSQNYLADNHISVNTIQK